MKTNERYLELQAYADGQLDQLEDLPPGRRAELERQLASDPEARAWIDGVRSLSRTLRANEPVHQVPASREFYWSQIQRKIDAAQRAKDGTATGAISPASRWGWLLPVFGLATAVLAIVMVSRGALSSGRTLVELAVSESGSDASEAMVFRSEAEGVTICWLD